MGADSEVRLGGNISRLVCHAAPQGCNSSTLASAESHYALFYALYPNLGSAQWDHAHRPHLPLQ